MVLEVKERLYRYWVYFRRGHGIYLAFILSLMNFLVIQYRLLIQKIPLLHKLMPNLWIFGIVFLPLYGVLAILVGYWDYRKGAYSTEASISTIENPFTRDWLKAVKLYMEGDKEEAIRIIERWIKE